MAIPIMVLTDIEGNSAPSVNVGVLVVPPISDAPIYQTIFLNQGWSLISSYIDTTQLEDWDSVNYPNTNYTADPYRVSDIFKQFLYKLDGSNQEYNVWDTDQSEYIENLTIVKDANGNAYLPEWNFDGINGIRFIDIAQGIDIAGVFQGLKIKMEIPGYYLKLNGLPPVPLSSDSIDFPMANGWNLIGFPSQEPISVVTFFENMPSENLLIAKDTFGNAYLPLWGFNGIGNLMPGQGYDVKLQDWVTGDSFVAKIFGQTVTPIVDEVDEVVDGITIIDSTITYTATSMTIKIPSDIIIPVIEHINIELILDTKVDLLTNYLIPIKSPGNEPLVGFNLEPPTKSEGKNALDFKGKLSDIYNNNIGHKEPSGYSLEAQDFIGGYWDIHRLHKNEEGNSLIDLFIETVSKHTIQLSFIAYTPNKGNFVGRTVVKIDNYKINEVVIALSVQGNDSTSSEIDGLLASESPIIYLFTGEKYILLTLEVVSGDLQFADRKIVEINSLTLGKEVSTPL